MVSDCCPIIGIGIIYSGQTRHFGTTEGTELMFLIDGPGGERIEGVEVMTTRRKPVMCGFKV